MKAENPISVQVPPPKRVESRPGDKTPTGILGEHKQKWPGFSQHGHDRADPPPLQPQAPAPPPLRQEVPRLNYAFAGAVNKLSGCPSTEVCKCLRTAYPGGRAS